MGTKLSDIVDLSPCPLCGGKAILKGYPLNHNYKEQIHWFVICKDCGYQTKKFYGHKEKAVKAWENRV